MVKRITLSWPIVNLSYELRGFDFVKIIEWHTREPLKYALGNGPAQLLHQGLELRISEDIYIFKGRKQLETMLIKLR